jgi:hypothetical protein
MSADRVLALASIEFARATRHLLGAEEALARVRTEVQSALRAEPRSDAIEAAQRSLKKGRVPAETGTPADGAIAALREATAAVDAARAALDPAFERDTLSLDAALLAAVEQPDFREALAWQNRGALQRVIAPLLARPSGSAPRAKDRKDRGNDQLIASYLQRYCAKNETIGFFGPVGWATFGEGETTVTPGPHLLARRGVYFEQWPIDELAKTIAADPRAPRWLPPRRYPFVTIEDGVARSAVSGRLEIGRAKAWLLGASDGITTAGALAEVAVLEGHFPDEAVVLEALADLEKQKLLAWTLEVPLSWEPDRTLRRRLEAFGDAALRADALARLDELDAARAAVRAAAGDVAALEPALAALDATFSRLTGADPTRNAGAMYAARQIVFEDCQRNARVTIGTDVLREIGPALSLLLMSARWLTHEIGRAYRDELRAIHRAIARGRPRLPFSELWFRAQRAIFGEADRPVDAIQKVLVDRWSAIIGAEPGERRVQRSSQALAPAVAEAFAAPGPGWPQARHHSPDLMIAAPSVDAIRRGELLVVLGELHVGSNTISSASFFAQHPEPEALARAYANDLPERLAMPLQSKEWLRTTVRTSRAFAPRHHAFVASGFDPAPDGPNDVLALADLFVEEADGQLVVRDAGGFSLEIGDYLGELLSGVAVNAFGMFPPADHSPRVTIDRLVVARESWVIHPEAMRFALEKTPQARLLGAQRWARELGLPRFVFAKSPTEVKPIYVDLDSSIFVDIFAKAIRRNQEHPRGASPIKITEMLPALDETWLEGADGAGYTSELRVVAVCE